MNLESIVIMITVMTKLIFLKSKSICLPFQTIKATWPWSVFEYPRRRSVPRFFLGPNYSKGHHGLERIADDNIHDFPKYFDE